jgi:hypothetical protein
MVIQDGARPIARDRFNAADRQVSSGQDDRLA